MLVMSIILTRSILKSDGLDKGRVRLASLVGHVTCSRYLKINDMYNRENIPVTVNIVTSEHGLSKKFGPLVIGCVLRTAGSFLY